MTRLALLLEYDGAAFGGSQLQANAPTVQGALEEAIARLGGAPVRAAFAGRTDAGVHALGQVAAFTTSARHSLEVWQRGLNALLPAEIAVRAVRVVSEGFDPRRWARSRTYRYLIWNMAVRSPLWRGRAWHVKEPLAEVPMARAAAALVGEHDFASFGGSPGPGRSTCRRIMRAALCRRGPLLTLELEGSAFLPHQVRRTAGALVEIGRGRLDELSFSRWLETPAANMAGPMAPAQGLCLIQVDYPDLSFNEELR